MKLYSAVEKKDKNKKIKGLANRNKTQVLESSDTEE
jgi:hypothetical protein